MKQLRSIVVLACIFFRPAFGMEPEGDLQSRNKKSYSSLSLSPKKQSTLNELLFEAIKSSNTAIIELLLDQGANPNAVESNGWTALHTACFNGNTHIIKLLLCHIDIQVNTANRDGWTPLHMTCFNGNTQATKLILGHEDVQVNTTNAGGWTALRMACFNGNIETIKLLLDRTDIAIDIPDNLKKTPLHIACADNVIEIITLLLKKLIRPEVTWQQARLLFIGQKKEQKESCNVAKLPRDTINCILSHCNKSDTKKIELLKTFIGIQDIKGHEAFCNAHDMVKKKLGSILDPKAWQDSHEAQKTYQELLNVLKEDKSALQD